MSRYWVEQIEDGYVIYDLLDDDLLDVNARRTNYATYEAAREDADYLNAEDRKCLSSMR
jgi:hypothetical protein